MKVNDCQSKDVFWAISGFIVMFVFIVSFIFVSLAYISPYMNDLFSIPPQTLLGSVIEVSLLIFFMLLGEVLAVCIMIFCMNAFVSSSDLTRWVSSFRKSEMYDHKVGKFIFEFLVENGLKV